MALGKQAKILTDKQVRAVLAETRHPALPAQGPGDVPLFDQSRFAG